MQQQRWGESETRAQFRRQNRFFANNDQWFFNTREGFIKGPYLTKQKAEEGLLDYLMELLEQDLVTFPRAVG